MGPRAGRQDHYEVLGLHSDAPDEVIRAAYRALAAKYHPDRNPGDSAAGLKLKRLNAAFRVLGDAETRKQYDELTQGPEAGDESPHEAPTNEPPRRKAPEEPPPAEPRWKVPEEPVRNEARWKSRDEDERASSSPHPAEPSEVERVATHAARGFGRVFGWLAGAAVAGAIFAALRGSCDENQRREHTSPPSAATPDPIVAPTAQRIWITDPNYRIAFPETPEPAETVAEKMNWGTVYSKLIKVRRSSGALYEVEQIDYSKGLFAQLPVAKRESAVSDATNGDFLVALGPTTTREYDQPATIGDCYGRRASATVGPLSVRWALCVVGLRSYMAIAKFPSMAGSDVASEATAFLDSFSVSQTSSEASKPSGSLR